MTCRPAINPGGWLAGKADATWTFTAGAKPESFYVEYAAE